MKQIESILRQLCSVVDKIVDKFSINSIRGISVMNEVKKNNIITVFVVLINIFMVMFNYFQIYSEIIISVCFLAILMMILYTSYMWNFYFCPEKKIIKSSVSVQIIIRFIILFNYCININLENYFEFGIISVSLSLCDIILCVVITKKAHRIVMSENIIVQFDPITDWERKNYKTIYTSISYLGIILYIISLCMFSEEFSIVRIAIKAAILGLAIYRIGDNFKNFYEHVEKAKKKLIVINVFLIIGFFAQVVGNYICLYCLEFGFKKMREVNDIFVLIGILCGIPLYNEYAKMSKRYRLIMKEVEL